MSSSTAIASKSLPPESVTDTCGPPPFSATCVSSFSPVQPRNIEELRTWLVRAFPASHSPLPESRKPKTTNATCGPPRGTLFASYSLHPYCLKTCQDLFPAATLEPSLVTWPRWGTWGGGEFWAQETPERRTSGTGFGSWPTPRKNSAMAAAITPEAAWDEKRFPNLETIVGRRLWATPTKHNAKECAAPSEFNRNTPTLAAQAQGGGARIQPIVLNPVWTEWLQGWPMGWTDLEPLEMDRCPSAWRWPGRN